MLTGLLLRILGAPDVYPSYGDNVNAWAPFARMFSREFIELGFNNNTPINLIEIYETYTPGAIDTVSVWNPYTRTIRSYTGCRRIPGGS